jgi:hypothetical protein
MLEYELLGKKDRTRRRRASLAGAEAGLRASAMVNVGRIATPTKTKGGIKPPKVVVKRPLLQRKGLPRSRTQQNTREIDYVIDHYDCRPHSAATKKRHRGMKGRGRNSETFIPWCKD